MNPSVRTQRQLTAMTVLMICLLGSLAAQDAVPPGAPEALDLVRRAEALMYPSAKATATLRFDDGKGRSESYGMIFYAKDRNQKIIVRFTAPAGSVGNDILMIEKNVWAYDKRSNRVMKIPSNQSFGGTGFSYGDVVRLNFSDNYDAKLSGATAAEWLLELNAKDRNAPYYRIALSIDKQGGWPVKGTCYAKSGAVVKEMVYAGVKDGGSGRKPLTLTVSSPSNPGETTVMTLAREEPKDLPDSIFNKRNLETRLEENL